MRKKAVFFNLSTVRASGLEDRAAVENRHQPASARSSTRYFVLLISVLLWLLLWVPSYVNDLNQGRLQRVMVN